MKSLQAAWDWYEATRTPPNLMNRLARKHWESLPWEQRLNSDDAFRTLSQDAIIEQTQTGLDFLGDLAVVVMFSVFESLVRDRVLTILDASLPATVDPVILRAIDSARDGIAEGSFFRVLDAHKQPGPSPLNDLIEQVNQVRKYRNWIAHGRRGKQPDVVTPRAAFERLQTFLTSLGLT